jgi:hypothetical protein
LFRAVFGLKAMAFSLFFAIALRAYVSIHPLCHYIGLKWRELLGAVRKSALVTLATAAGCERLTTSNVPPGPSAMPSPNGARISESTARGSLAAGSSPTCIQQSTRP